MRTIVGGFAMTDLTAARAGALSLMDLTAVSDDDTDEK